MTPSRGPAREFEVTNSGSLPYIPAFDGVRALAVIAVVGVHVNFTGLGGGGFGVDMFLVLSGCLITMVLLQPAEDPYRRFYAKRALRILPELLVVVAVCAPFAPWIVSKGYAGYGIVVVGALTFSTNWLLATHTIAPGGGMDFLWSLAIEEQFYLLWPAVLLTSLRRGASLAAIRRAVVIAAVTVTVVRVVTYRDVAYPGWPFAYFNSFLRADGILMGCALGLTFADRRPRPTPRVERVCGVGAVVALIVIALCFQMDRAHHQAFAYRYGFTLVNLSTTGLLAALLLAPSTLVGRLFARRSVTWIGRLSYSIYLVHQPVLFVTRSVAPGVYARARYRVPIAIVGSMALAMASYYLVGRRTVPLRARLNARRSPGLQA